MDIIEFRATVKRGKIEIPPQYQDKVKDRMRVIILPEDENQPLPTLIDQLLEHPLTRKGFFPLTREDIYVR